MIEAKQELSLPHVSDADPEVEPRLAELLGEVIEGNIPGLGIIRVGMQMPTHLSAHKRHCDLVLRAAGYLKPQIDFADTFSDYYLDENRSSESMLHVDPDSSRWLNDGRAELRLRLHTAGIDSESNVVLVNTRTASARDIGDELLFYGGGSPTEKARRYGYDGQPFKRGFFGQDELYKHVLEDVLAVDTIHVDQRVYRFTQRPFASVLFRSAAVFGPVAVHSFASPSQSRRDVCMSDLRVFSQSI